MAMATRVAIMDRGRVIEVGSPREIYEKPRSRFVADFIGGANILDAEPAGPGRVTLPALGVTCPVSESLTEKGWVALRPERIQIGPMRPDQPDAPGGKVEAVAFHGDFQCYRLTLDSGVELRVADANVCTLHPGDRAALSWSADAPVVLTR
jgi:ABC-type Fe3+/spermidine/putrescine transport system ATPase subunit